MEINPCDIQLRDEENMKEKITTLDNAKSVSIHQIMNVFWGHP